MPSPDFSPHGGESHARRPTYCEPENAPLTGVRALYRRADASRADTRRASTRASYRQNTPSMAKNVPEGPVNAFARAVPGRLGQSVAVKTMLTAPTPAPTRPIVETSCAVS